MGNAQSSELHPLAKAAANGDLQEVQRLLSVQPAAEVDCKVEDTGRTALHYAVEHLEILELLLKHKANPNIQDSSGKTALHTAASGGHSATTAALLKAGADPNSWDSQGRTPLILAAQGGHVKIMQLLLPEGGDEQKQLAVVNHRASDTGATALHLACQQGSLEAVKFLLAHKADLTLKSGGFSVLHMATSFGHSAIAAALLEAGADPNPLDSQGWTPLILAAQGGHVKIMQLLLPEGGDEQKQVAVVNHQASDTGATALHLASQQGSLEAVKFLLAHKANVTIRSVDGRTALHTAAGKGHSATTAALLEAGADPNSLDSQGRTPLILAAQGGHVKIMQLLLPEGGDEQKQVAVVNHQESDTGATALHLASQQGSLEAVKFLLAHKADLTLTIKGGFSVLHTAAGKGNSAATAALLEAGADPNVLNAQGATPLFFAVNEGHVEVIKALLNNKEKIRKADPNIKNSSTGETVLHIAIQNVGSSSPNAIEVVELLLQHNTDPNIKRTVDEATALHLAIQQDCPGVVKLLLTHKANPNTEDLDKVSVLHVASQNGNPTIVAALLQAGACPNAVDAENWTPLMFAAQGRHLVVMRLLLTAGGDGRAAVDCQEKDCGETALHRACRQGHPEVVELLLAHNADPTKEMKDGWTPLLTAARYGHVEVMRRLLPFSPLPPGPSPQEGGGLAGSSGHAEEQEGAVVDHQTSDHTGATALHLVSYHGNLEAVKLLLAHKANPNIPDAVGKTPLHLAVGKGHSATTAALLEAGADPNVLNAQGATPLFFAAYEGHVEVIKALLNNKERSISGGKGDNGGHQLKADPNIQNSSTGETALHIAAATAGLTSSGEMAPSFKAHVEVVELLLNHGANPNVKDSSGKTALHVATNNSYLAGAASLMRCDESTPMPADIVAAQRHHLEAVALMLGQDKANTAADPNIQDANGDTAIHVAIKDGYLGAVKLLVANGAQMTLLGSLGRSPLDAAVFEGSKEIIQFLLDTAKADIKMGFPLHTAVESRSVELVEFVLDCGAEVNACRSEGNYNSLSKEVHERHGETDLPFRHTALNEACSTWPNREMAKLLLSRGADPTITEPKTGFTCLHLACIDRNCDALRLLLTTPRLLDVDTVDSYGCTALHYAATGDGPDGDIRSQLLLQLLEAGADPNAVTGDGGVALHTAAEDGDAEVVKLLLSHGADPELLTPDTKATSLHLAALKGHPDVVKLFLEKGTDSTLLDANGCSALQLAILGNHPKCVEAFLEVGQLNVNGEVGSRNCPSPLYQAARAGAVDVVEVLLEHKGDPAVRATDCEETPLETAMRNLVRAEQEMEESKTSQTVPAAKRAKFEAVVALLQPPVSPPPKVDLETLRKEMQHRIAANQSAALPHELSSEESEENGEQGKTDTTTKSTGAPYSAETRNTVPRDILQEHLTLASRSQGGSSGSQRGGSVTHLSGGGAISLPNSSAESPPPTVGRGGGEVKRNKNQKCAVQ